ncbi:hypothetical protein RJ639_023121 [Escallonia herrerae]|uniref:Retrotransposon gag domain-containing protein n=1 Tax=Escallonia herrerae TaxID=1293975 RepID=A0AA88UZJ1_9ASTE|nr:hypothetical protein RJ639_023121 [Escallonia herrerae]
MMTSAISLEEQLAVMSRAIEKLTKTVEEKDLQIANLMNKLESKKSEESKSGDMDDADEALKEADTNEHPDASTFGGYKNKERNAFDWYTNLEPESIDCWEEMEREFQNRFYTTRRSVSMMELTNTKQGKEEPVVDYINRWRALSLDYKERLSEASTVEMCMQGMHWGLLYILQGNKLRTFEELATQGHNMEITIASHGGSNPPIGDPREDTREARWRWGSKATTEDSMVVMATPLKTSNKQKKKKQDKKKNQPQGRERQRPKFKELEQKVYPFSDSKVPGILDFLLQHKLIDLPKMKRTEEVGQVNEPRYCKYHRLISHPTEKCFTLKEVIMDLSKKGKIHLDDEQVEESNNASIIFGSVVFSDAREQIA